METVDGVPTGRRSSGKCGGRLLDLLVQQVPHTVRNISVETLPVLAPLLSRHPPVVQSNLSFSVAFSQMSDYDDDASYVPSDGFDIDANIEVDSDHDDASYFPHDDVTDSSYAERSRKKLRGDVSLDTYIGEASAIATSLAVTLLWSAPHARTRAQLNVNRAVQSSMESQLRDAKLPKNQKRRLANKWIELASVLRGSLADIAHTFLATVKAHPSKYCLRARDLERINANVKEELGLDVESEGGRGEGRRG